MSELKYSGFIVALICGIIATLLIDNLYVLFAGIIVGILYEVINK